MYRHTELLVLRDLGTICWQEHKFPFGYCCWFCWLYDQPLWNLYSHTVICRVRGNIRNYMSDFLHFVGDVIVTSGGVYYIKQKETFEALLSVWQHNHRWIVKGPRCFLEQETLPHCLVLVGSRNGFEHEFTIDLKIN